MIKRSEFDFQFDTKVVLSDALSVSTYVDSDGWDSETDDAFNYIFHNKDREMYGNQKEEFFNESDGVFNYLINNSSIPMVNKMKLIGLIYNQFQASKQEKNGSYYATVHMDIHCIPILFECMVNEEGFDFNIIQQIFDFMHCPDNNISLHWIMWFVEAQLMFTLRLPIISTNLIAPIEDCVIVQCEQLAVDCLKTVKLIKNENELLHKSFRKNYRQDVIAHKYEGCRYILTWTQYTLNKRDDNPDYNLFANVMKDVYFGNIIFLPHSLVSVPICGATLKSLLTNEIKKGKYILDWLKHEGYRNDACTCAIDSLSADFKRWQYMNWIDMIIDDPWTGSKDAWRVCFVSRLYKEYSSIDLPLTICGQRMNDPKWIWL